MKVLLCLGVFHLMTAAVLTTEQGTSVVQPSPTSVANFNAPYVEPPLQCPQLKNGVMGICVIDSACAKDGNGDCGSGKLCCSNGCGITCVSGTVPDPLCTAVKQKAQNTTLLGVYIPQCEDNGQFSQMQCHERYCWCVDVLTGKALSQPVLGTVTCSNSSSTTVVSATPTAPTCTNGKIYEQCGTACPLTCKNKDNPPVICPAMCVSGCFCPKGLVANDDGGCVQPDQCPSSASNTVSPTPAVQNFNAPYVEPPLQCPDVNERGACVIESPCAKDGNGDCGSGKLCCSNGCGITCVSGTVPDPLCTAVKQKAQNTTLLGVYIPQCEDNGQFSQMQCHERYCWCVDILTGKALSQPVLGIVTCSNSSSTTVLSATPTAPTCTNGKVYEQCGTTCPLTCDNKDNPPSICSMVCVQGCFCPSGTVQSGNGCVKPEQCPTKAAKNVTKTIPDYCSLPPEAGLCEAAISSYFFNSTSQRCEQFIYGGCGGNSNNFDTLLSCMEKCAGVKVELPSVSANLSQVAFCPSLSQNDDMGTCADQCSIDSDCEDFEMCCSNGCGHRCATPTMVPYYKPPMTCPSIDSMLQVFCSIDFGCKSNDVCKEDELCCPTGCGSMCMTGIKPDRVCETIKNSTTQTGLIGAYTPQCDDNGNFSVIQCHASTGSCWCADTLTGKPLTLPVMFQQPECDNLLTEKKSKPNCQGIECEWPNCGKGVKPITDDKHCCPYCPSSSCTVNGVTHANGTSFTAADGCNTCHCINGVAGCTRMFCSPCVVDGVTHPSGSSYTASDGCNTCHCINGEAACTEMECAPCVVNGVTHPSGSSYTAADGCNTCHCSNGEAACTLMLCPPCVVNGVSHPSGSSYTASDGCNTCHCMNGIAACTEMACAPCVVNGVTHPSGSNFPAPDGCNTCYCTNGEAACTEMACIYDCNAGGMRLSEGQTIDDGCSVCTCSNKKIACTKSDKCASPIHKSINVTMKYNGNFDSVSRDAENFKNDVKSSLIKKYGTSTGLLSSQITQISITRGSIIVTVVINDNSDDTSANVTHLLIQMEQDYKNQSLFIVYQDMVLTPSDDFTYTQTNTNNTATFSCFGFGGFSKFWLYVSVGTLLLVMMLVLATAAGIHYKRRRCQFRHTRIPLSDIDQDVVTVKGVNNPMFVVKTEKI